MRGGALALVRGVPGLPVAAEGCAVDGWGGGVCAEGLCAHDSTLRSGPAQMTADAPNGVTVATCGNEACAAGTSSVLRGCDTHARHRVSTSSTSGRGTTHPPPSATRSVGRNHPLVEPVETPQDDLRTRGRGPRPRHWVSTSSTSGPGATHPLAYLSRSARRIQSAGRACRDPVRRPRDAAAAGSCRPGAGSRRANRGHRAGSAPGHAAAGSRSVRRAAGPAG